MNKIEAWAWGSNGIGVILTTIQTNQIFQLLSLILTILATLTSLIISCITLYQKFKNGEKIGVDELKKLQKELEEANQKIQDLQNNKEE